MVPNADTQSQDLLDQGFEKVALPEVRLFGGAPQNFCTLYQKGSAHLPTRMASPAAQSFW